MPALYALGQHRALVAVQATLLPSEKLSAFLDDTWVVANAHRIAAIYAELERAFGLTRASASTWAKRSCSTGEVSCHLVANTSSKRAGR